MRVLVVRCSPEKHLEIVMRWQDHFSKRFEGQCKFCKEFIKVYKLERFGAAASWLVA